MRVRSSLLILVTVGVPFLAVCSGFATPHCINGAARPASPKKYRYLTRRLRLDASSSDSNNDNDTTAATNSLPSGFNPFNYQRSQSNVPSSSNPTRILSLRKNRMQEITSQLLEAVSASSSTGSSHQADSMATMILQENREFLLEPLECMDAVLEPDSIYTSSMTRSERYQVYRKQMQDRIANARNPASRRVLQVLHDFVLSHE